MMSQKTIVTRNERYLTALLLAAGLGAVSACRPGPPADTSYVGKITAAREQKDVAFRREPDKPVPPNCMDQLLPLDYYLVDPSYNVPTVLTPTARDEALQVATSTGTIENARRLGELEFTLQGRVLRLTAFASEDSGAMWVPFKDTTNGKETYKAGRYLNISRNSTGVYELDFNYAYNPHCYFNLSYTCPIPPPENTLDFAISAGEQAVKKCS